MNQTVAAAPSEVKQRAVKRSRVGQLWLDIKKHNISFLFLAPFLILFTTFTIIPVAISFVQSFMYYNIVEKPRWIGWSNFKLLFVDDEVFLKAIANTLKFALVTGPIGYILAFLLAWLISQIPVKYRFFYTLCFYTPAITSGVAISVIWLYLFSGDSYGLINYWAIKLGIIDEPYLWLSNVKTMMPVLVIVTLWSSMGIGFLAFLAGLQNVSRDLYEAGAIDGIRYRWQELWYITVPSVKPQLLFGAVLQVVGSLQVSDLSTALFGNPSVLYAGHLIMSHLQDYAFIRFEMGYASAIAVFLFLLMAALNKLIFKWLGDRG